MSAPSLHKALYIFQLPKSEPFLLMQAPPADFPHGSGHARLRGEMVFGKTVSNNGYDESARQRLSLYGGSAMTDTVLI